MSRRSEEWKDLPCAEMYTPCQMQAFPLVWVLQLCYGAVFCHLLSTYTPNQANSGCLKVITSLLIKNGNYGTNPLLIWIDGDTVCVGRGCLERSFNTPENLQTHKPPGSPYPADMRRNKICSKTYFSKRKQRTLSHSGLVWNQVTQAVKLF